MTPTPGRPAAAARRPRDTADASWASSPSVRAKMQRQQTRDTAPELAVRRLLHAAGLRYRVDVAPLPGLRRRADVVFRPAKVAVYVDGCFWHGCPEHATRKVKANADYWAAKVEKNKQRDADTDLRLREAGWLVVRIWEHDDPTEAACGVADAVRARQNLSRSRPPV